MDLALPEYHLRMARLVNHVVMRSTDNPTMMTAAIWVIVSILMKRVATNIALIAARVVPVMVIPVVNELLNPTY